MRRLITDRNAEADRLPAHSSEKFARNYSKTRVPKYLTVRKTSRTSVFII